MIDPKALAAELDIVVRAVPGVVSLYSTAPAIVSAVRQLAEGPEGAEGGTLVTVRSVHGVWQVATSIGVASTVQAPRTAAAVSAALLAAIPDGLEAAVTVRISRILS